MNKINDNFLTIINLFSNFRIFQQTQNILENNKFNFSIKNLNASLKSIYVSSIFNQQNRHFIILCEDNKSAENWYDDLLQIVNEDHISILKEHKKRTLEAELSVNLSHLVDGLNKILEQYSTITIITKDILYKKVPDKWQILDNKTYLKVGREINYNEFIHHLLLRGFQREIFVSQPGEIALRGQIIDIFPIAFDNPIRIELYDNKIENIRQFEPLSQRSIKTHNEISFINTTFDISNNFEGTIFDYLDDRTVFIYEYFEFKEDIKEKIDKFSKIVLNPLTKTDIEVSSQPQKNFKSQINLFKNDLLELIDQNYKVTVAAGGEIHLKRLKELLELSLDNYAVFEKLVGKINWMTNSLSSGFILEDEKFAYFTEHQIFNRQRIATTKKSKKQPGLSVRELRQLQIGDYVVHEDKGIGRFDGFQTIEIAGNKQDAMRIIFADGDLLYVHLNYIHKIQKYTASDGAIPHLTKLGSAEWKRKKAKVKSRLKDIARDLIKLYAKRKSSIGYAFPADDIWQQEFEASFYFEDTADQAKATADVKRDMESNYPMDRLICGDVGFGKTEIAIRAAFKAATAGKQVAVLVPTTILAEQHYSTFTDRIAQYPIKIEVLSRFKSKNEQKEILEKLSNGEIDIIIGTHRILSSDVKFKNLGLLIIDEEHRFGVAAKEKLRQIKVNVDTLTMTATPIPRTLNFSLLGARDLSIIETPPRNRLPIETEVIEFNIDYIAEAIFNEINRDGQVFFVNDKIEGLEKLVYELQMKLPQIKFGIVHGQMPTQDLENVMRKFLERKFNVLFATKIIEAGIDIPNANTMIINNAHNFGLAELYQLRGRVGRSDVQAYCYLVVPSFKMLKKQAIQRLQAIEEFTELGSGLQLAMRDLEIRGAGNLLGAEQSGFIIDIGYDLYQKILDEAVLELKIEEFPDLFDATTLKAKQLDNDINIEIDKDAFFPENYINNQADRFIYYKALFNCTNNSELDDLVKEIIDKYGKLPEEAKNLIFAVRLRIAALNTGFTKIILKNKKLVAEFPESSNEFYYNNLFIHIVEFLNTLSHLHLKQTKTKLLLEYELSSDNDAIELLWKIKRTISLLLNS